MLLAKISIAEDNPIYRDLLHKVLDKQQYFRVVSESDNGEDLLKQIRKAKPNLFLLDVIMPNTDIIKTIQKIKEIDPDIHILIHSHFLYDGIIISLHKAGCCGFVEKIDFETLIQAITGMIKDGHYYGDRVL